MPRIRVRRELCDCISCTDDTLKDTKTQDYVALARQEPPAKSLVISIDNAICPDPSHLSLSSLDLVSYPHLDSIAREGCCGILYTRLPTPGTPPSSVSLLHDQLLHASSIDCPLPEPYPTRFKQIHASLITNSTEISAIGNSMECDTTSQTTNSLFNDLDQLANEIAHTILGICPIQQYIQSFTSQDTTDSIHLRNGDVGDKNDGKNSEYELHYDMAMLILNNTQSPTTYPHTPKTSSGRDGEHGERSIDTSCKLLEWLNLLLSKLDAIPGFKETVLLTIILGTSSNGSSSNNSNGNINNSNGTHPGENAIGPIQRPLQSYQFSGMKRVDVDYNAPAIIIHRLEGVIRRDCVASLAIDEIRRLGGGQFILAERVLHEITYKIGRKQKYGA